MFVLGARSPVPYSMWATVLAPSSAMFLLASVTPTAALVINARSTPMVAMSTTARRPPIVSSLADPSFEGLPAALASIRELRPANISQSKLWRRSGRDPTYKVSGTKSNEPSFTRLFTHETWLAYTDRPPRARWFAIALSWRYSTVLKAVLPISLIAAAWAYLISRIPAVLLPRTSPVPMSLIGTAIGLLLVFRTNNSYQRLSEARALWGSMVIHCREIAQGTATALAFDGSVPEPQVARDGAARVCRYLAAFAWEMAAKLTGPVDTDDNAVLMAMLPEHEAAWISPERSRPLLLLGALRRELHAQFRAGNLPTHLHRKLEEDVRELDTVVGTCERLFSSPLPPTMSRHIVRSLLLWLVGFPLVLAGTMAPWCVAGWVFVTSYIYVGIDEVGVQVEQPFEIVPMAWIASLIVDNLDEAFLVPPKPT